MMVSMSLKGVVMSMHASPLTIGKKKNKGSTNNETKHAAKKILLHFRIILPLGSNILFFALSKSSENTLCSTFALRDFPVFPL